MLAKHCFPSHSLRIAGTLWVTPRKRSKKKKPTQDVNLLYRNLFLYWKVEKAWKSLLSDKFILGFSSSASSVCTWSNDHASASLLSLSLQVNQITKVKQTKLWAIISSCTSKACSVSGRQHPHLSRGWGGSCSYHLHQGCGPITQVQALPKYLAAHTWTLDVDFYWTIPNTCCRPYLRWRSVPLPAAILKLAWQQQAIADLPQTLQPDFPNQLSKSEPAEGICGS